MPLSELAKLMLLQVITKTLYEVVMLPVTIRVVRYVKQHEGTDVYDENVSYNPLKFSEI